VSVRIRELTPAFGADVEGLDLSGPLDDESIRILRQTFDERGVLRFRDVDIAAEAHASLARVLVDGEPVVYRHHMSNREPEEYATHGSLLYHSDMMWADTPMELLSLYGLEIEQPSVPTEFVSATHAWDTLPDELRRRVDGLQAVHVTGQQVGRGDTAELLPIVHERARSATKPVAYRHPRTGRTILYVAQMMTSHIDGLELDESEQLLDELFAHLYAPENSWQHEWRDRDLVMWDNLAVQHARPPVALDGPARVLRKVTAPAPSTPVSRPATNRVDDAGSPARSVSSGVTRSLPPADTSTNPSAKTWN
jgi:alpha-ketoglutarate-dependent taurine dioxygenase